ncbi:hypothetical protein EVAR_70594_1 [Eumeta japonica]|uniref:Uncharacterized protein n=1 Tax=Eumeta variegata TaxID=151549 RepID=A0A4C2AAU3_EUMVA|nr:hypothetical protein EVAR_70594_1 [Eumeta japonica]
MPKKAIANRDIFVGRFNYSDGVDSSFSRLKSYTLSVSGIKTLIVCQLRWTQSWQSHTELATSEASGVNRLAKREGGGGVMMSKLRVETLPGVPVPGAAGLHN